MLKHVIILATLLALCGCQDARQTAMAGENRTIEWNSLISIDNGDNHGGFGTII